MLHYLCLCPYPYLGYKTQCRKTPIAFPPHHQSVQPGLEYMWRFDYKYSFNCSLPRHQGHNLLIDYSATKGAIVSLMRSLALSLVSKWHSKYKKDTFTIFPL